MTSTQRQSVSNDTAVDASSVAEYLRQHPDFFEQNRSLLNSLTLPHGGGGGTVSLVERQVATLRQKNLKLDRRLRELIEIAQQNDKLSAKIHTLTMELVACDSADAIVARLEEHLRTAFAAEYAVLVVFDDGPLADVALTKRRFVRPLPAASETLAPFRTFLDGKRTRCGQIRDAQRVALFGEDGDDIGSAALVPLGTDPLLGFLAIGNRDRNHFNPAISTEFLTRLGQILSATLHRSAG
ncbi:MAG: DUF484 family protein [Pseudomonadota bacterium]